MFGNELEYTIPLPNSMRIAIINQNYKNLEIITKIQEKILFTNKKQIQFVLVENVKKLFKYKEDKQKENNKGLMNKRWINNIINYIPSLIILNYQINSGSNKENEEKNLCNILGQIRQYSKSCYIMVNIINRDIQDNDNNLTFNFDDKQKPYYLKAYLPKDCFYIFKEEEIWESIEFIEICTKILFYSREFYKSKKKKYQEKRSKSTTREEKIIYDIKLGIISSIKSQKEQILESKYLEEAYEFLCDKNFDLKGYKYGNKPINIKNNFYEIRAIADWLFFKFNNFRKNTRLQSISISKNKLGTNIATHNRSNTAIKNINIKEQLKKIKRHVSRFTNTKYFDNGKKDYFHFVEYYWIIQRYKNITEYIEENISNVNVSNKVLIKLGMILMIKVYNLIRMIKFYKENFAIDDFNLYTIDNGGKKLNIEEIQEEENNYFGKPPSYYLIDKENPENKEVIGYNDEIYIKKFLLKNNINYNDMIENFKNKYWYHLFSYFSQLKEKFSNKNKNNETLKGINMYIYLLKIIGLCNTLKNENIFEINDINNIYTKSLYNFEKIKKFPKVYMHFIKQYINLLQYKLNKENKNNNISKDNFYKTEMFINISLLGNLRKLDSEEENLFFKLLNDEQFIPLNKNKDEKIIIKLNYYNNNNINIIQYNDLAFNFNYIVKNINKYQNRKLLDIIEYEIQFRSTLNQEKVKLGYLKLDFEYIKEEKNIKEKIIKEYNKEQLNMYELSQNSEINIIHKLIIKSKNGRIIFNKIIFSFDKKENIYYSIDIPYEINKTIFITDQDTKVLDIYYPKQMLIAGLNQFYNFEYEIKKVNIQNIKITDYIHIFEGEQMNKDKLISQLGEKSDSNANIIKNDKLNKLKLEKTKKNNKKINKDILYYFIFGNSTGKPLLDDKEVNLIPPKFYYLDEEKNEIIESQKNLYLSYIDFEERLKEGKNKYDLLIKFYNFGIYKIKLNIKYFVVHEEVDAKIEYSHEKIFYFKVIDPFLMRSKIYSNNYLLKNDKENNTKTNIYLTDTNLDMKLMLKNLLEEDIIIKDIIIKLNEYKNVEIKSTLKNIIDSSNIEEDIKEQILSILPLNNYIIPYDVKFFESFNGPLGKIKFIWTTKALKEFENNKNIKVNKLILKNENEYNLPNMNIDKMQIKFDYQYTIKNGNEINIDIKITNKDLYNKKLSIKIVKGDDNTYIISGSTRILLNLKSQEIKKIKNKLIILQKGEIKLPDVIIKEKDYNRNQIFYYNYSPEKIVFQ